VTLLRATAVVAAALLVAACGYRWTGAPGASGDLRVAVDPVEDRGDEPLFGAVLARALAREVVDRPGLRLARAGEGDVRVRATVLRVVEEGATYSAAGLQEYRIRAEVRVEILPGPSGRPWKGVVAADREFPAGATVEATQEAKEAALDLLARDLARAIARRAQWLVP